MKRSAFVLAFVLIFSVVQYSQGLAVGASARPAAPPKVDPAKEAEKLSRQVLLAEQVIAEAQGLRLLENRAFVFARAASLLWMSDKKAARDMFQRSVTELSNAQMRAEAAEAQKTNLNDARIMLMARSTILTTIGARDAEFALDAMNRTRTPSIQKALAFAAEAATMTRISDVNGMMRSKAQAELNLEQRLMRLAAEQNPERASKLLQDTIRKGLSNETFSLLKRFYDKDPELATTLAGEVMDKLQSSSFSVTESDNQTRVYLATAILTDSLRVLRPNVKELRFEELGLRSLAGKLIAYAIANSNSRGGYVNMAQMIKIAEKYSPASVAALKKIEKANMPPGNRLPPSEARRVAEGNMTAAQLLAEAKKLPAESRSPMYLAAATKMSQSGDYNGALALLNENFTGSALEDAVNGLNWSHASHLMNQAKWAEAERLIEEFPESTRRSALIMLATKIFAKDPVQNKAYALSVLSKIRETMLDRPSEQREMMQLMQLSSAYAAIEPDEAFNTFDPAMPILNELTDANAIVQGFQGYGNVKMGEFLIISGPNWGFQFDPNLLRVLAKADFERTTKLIDRFTRRELRIALKLQLAESGLN